LDSAIIIVIPYIKDYLQLKEIYKQTPMLAEQANIGVFKLPNKTVTRT